MPKTAAAEKPGDRPYDRVRSFIGLLGFGFPILVPLVAYLISRHGLEESISAYYYTSSGSIFVGGLWAIGFLLLLYQPYNKVPDKIASWLAWFFALCITIFPTWPAPADICPQPPTVPAATCVSAIAQIITPDLAEKFHHTAAVLFFIAIAFYAVFLFTQSNDEELLIENITRKKWRNYAYLGLTVIIIISVLVSIVLRIRHSQTFWAELFGVWAFGLIWLTKGNFIPGLREIPIQDGKQSKAKAQRRTNLSGKRNS